MIERLGPSELFPVNMHEALKCDIVVLVTDHDDYKEIKPQMIVNNLFICTRPILDPEEFKNNGIIFKGIGRVSEPTIIKFKEPKIN